jgi:uncharacterized protein YdeI (YjbR/CyaY-like superfamily)
MEPVFFRSPVEFRAWLAEHHASERELLLGFYKKRSGVTGFTQSQAVEEALCYGWIDGHVRAIDADRYTARFTPRTPQSIWSAVNVRKMEQLIAEGRMQPVGLKTFEGRDKRRAGKYAYENRPKSLDADDEARFRANTAAWEYFSAQAPSYQRTAIWWVVSAKNDATHQKRLATLIEDSAGGRRLKHLSYGGRAARTAPEVVSRRMSDLTRKLGIVPGFSMLLIDAPESDAALLREACPPDVVFDTEEEGASVRYDLILFWPRSADGLVETFAALQWRIVPDGAIWAALLKKPIARRRGITLTWEEMQAAALQTALVDNKIASISDETYGTRFVIRRERRPTYAASLRHSAD